MTPRPFGGEPPAPAWDHDVRFTDSGRSSLRLLCRGALRGRRVLLPDFLCPVIPRVLAEEGVAHAYYHVTGELLPDRRTLRPADGDVVYLIGYFGRRTALAPLGLDPTTLVVEDNVFLPDAPPPDHGPWASFTSWRKALPLAEGSLLRTRLAVGEPRPGPAPFAAAKQTAMAAKRAFLAHGTGREQDYLDLFARGEALLDAQRDVHRPTDRTLARLAEVMAGLGEETRRRRDNHRFLRQRLARLALPLEPDYPGVFVLRCANRDAVRRRLRDAAVYLPVHWPRGDCPPHPLYDEILSVPVDSRYGLPELERVADLMDGLCEQTR